MSESNVLRTGQKRNEADSKGDRISACKGYRASRFKIGKCAT